MLIINLVILRLWGKVKLKLLRVKFHGPCIKMCLKQCKAVLHLEVQSCASTTLMKELLFHRGGVFWDLFLLIWLIEMCLCFRKLIGSSEREDYWFCIIVVCIFHWKYQTRQYNPFKQDNCKSSYENKSRHIFTESIPNFLNFLKCIHSLFIYFLSS